MTEGPLFNSEIQTETLPFLRRRGGPERRAKMFYLLTALIVIGILFFVVKAIGGRRYADMTSEEFEAEAKRSSTMGIAVAGLQKIVDPSHKIELMQEQQQRAETDSSESGDRPETGKPPAPKS